MHQSASPESCRHLLAQCPQQPRHISEHCRLFIPRLHCLRHNVDRVRQEPGLQLLDAHGVDVRVRLLHMPIVCASRRILPYDVRAYLTLGPAWMFHLNAAKSKVFFCPKESGTRSGTRSGPLRLWCFFASEAKVAIAGSGIRIYIRSAAGCRLGTWAFASVAALRRRWWGWCRTILQCLLERVFGVCGNRGVELPLQPLRLDLVCSNHTCCPQLNERFRVGSLMVQLRHIP